MIEAMCGLHDELKEIRTDLRLAMNGVISSSMREKGVVYKLNFGVAYPEIKHIAAKHKPSSGLAEALWNEDIREFKILASFLHPADEMSLDKALSWVADIPYMEIAEHCSRNLFSNLTCREELISTLLSSATKETFSRIVGFLTAAEVCRRKEKPLEKTIDLLLKQSVASLLLAEETSISERFAAMQALKFYGRQSAESSGSVFKALDECRDSNVKPEELDEIYNELKFEFEYYL